MIESLWFALSNKRILFFGNECRTAYVTMLSFLFIRGFLHLCRLQWIIPYGVIFAFPQIFQVFAYFE